MPSQCCRWELLAKKEFQALMGPLSPPCRDYAAIVFFANNRFETGKKKLQYLSFGDFAFCAELMIQNWTLGAVGEAPTDPGAWTPPHLLRAWLPTSGFSCRPPFPASFLLQGPSPATSAPSPVFPPTRLQTEGPRLPYGLGPVTPRPSHSTCSFISWGAMRWWGRKARDVTGGVFISHPNSLHGPHSDPQADDMDMDLDKEFLQDLKELKVLVADKDLLDLHKR